MKWELGLWQDTWGRTKPNPKSLKNEVGLENSRDEKDLTTDRKVGRKRKEVANAEIQEKVKWAFRELQTLISVLLYFL